MVNKRKIVNIVSNLWTPKSGVPVLNKVCDRAYDRICPLCLLLVVRCSVKTATAK